MMSDRFEFKVKCDGCSKEILRSQEEKSDWTMCCYDYRRCGFSGCSECVAKHNENCPQKDKTDEEVFPESFNIEKQVCNQCEGGSLYQKAIVTDSTKIREVYLVEIPNCTKYICPDCGDIRETLDFNDWVQKKRVEKVREDVAQQIKLPQEALSWLAWAEKYYRM
jgi:hypothetical protein